MSTISPTSASAAVLPVPHLLLPFAACADASWLATLKALPAAQTQNFAKLLQGMQLLHTDSGDALAMSPPHERALARLHGLGGLGGNKLLDGLIPWAAWEHEQSTQCEPADEASPRHWAYVTPCYWLMGHEQASLTDPNDLALSEADSRALMAAMQVYFEADGIRLHYAAPQRWLAEGEVFKDLPTASLDRVLGRSVNPWLPAGSSGKTLRRLQNEMQMLLYTHPINDVRSSQRQLPVNSIWFSGTGDLPEQHTPEQQQLTTPRTLADAALRDDWQAYAEAWGVLDAHEAKDLLARQSAGEVVRLTLCGERTAQTFESASRSLLVRFKQLLKPKPLLGLLETL